MRQKWNAEEIAKLTQKVEAKSRQVVAAAWTRCVARGQATLFQG